MRPDNGAVCHQIWVVAALERGLEHPLPDPVMAPAAEAAMDRFPLPMALRQVAPMRAPVQDSKTTIDERAVAACGSAGITDFSGLKQCDPRPLSIAQFVAIRGHPERRDPNTEFYEPLKVVVGIPECRYGLALGPKYACHVSE